MDPEITPEEQQLDQEASKDAKEEEVRASVITEYGFDEVDDAERIDKLTHERIEQRKKFNSAVKQKITYREKAKELSTKLPAPPVAPTPTAEDLDTKLAEKLEQRDLDEMELPEDIKKEIKRVAQITGVTVRKAAKDPYVVSKIEAYNKTQAAEEAALDRKTNRSRGTKEFSSTPPDVDMSTEEGRKTWDDWKAWAIKQGNQGL